MRLKGRVPKFFKESIASSRVANFVTCAVRPGYRADLCTCVDGGPGAQVQRRRTVGWQQEVQPQESSTNRGSAQRHGEKAFNTPASSEMQTGRGVISICRQNANCILRDGAQHAHSGGGGGEGIKNAHFKHA